MPRQPDFFAPPPAVPGLTDVGENQQRSLETLSQLFGKPNRFEDARSTFQEGIDTLSQAAKEDPRLTPLVASAIRMLQGPGNGVELPRRRGDVNRVSSLPLPGGAVKVKGA
jgi:hypothetical protein